MLFSNIKKRGITLTELLVVLAIIGLLATLAIPAYINRVEQAKVGAARAEVEEIAKAEDLLALTHGFYLPLQLLDNVPNTNAATTPPADDFSNESLSTLSAIDISIPIRNQQGNQGAAPYYLRLDQTTNNLKLKNMLDNWGGPFLAPKRVYTGINVNPYAMTTEQVRKDFPLDPWNRPYRFFSPLGLIGSTSNTTTYSNLGDSFSDGVITTLEDRFDRFAIVSYGKDGDLTERGSTQANDDIYYLFGSGETTYNPTF